jgi:voltage-gated potassium channel
MDRDRRVDRINRALDLPLAVLALVMLTLVLIDLFATVPPETRLWLERANWACWAVFALEYAVKLVVSERPRDYVRRHWFDALVLIVPMFRVVRALRALQVIKAFPTFRLAAFMGMGLRGSARFFRKYQLGYLTALTAIVTLGCAALVYGLERDVPGTRFTDIGASLWWSAALMTTIASDMNPQTAWGRVVAVLEMGYAMVVFVYVVGAVSAELLHPPQAPTVDEGLKEMDGEDGRPAIAMAPPAPASQPQDGPPDAVDRAGEGRRA